ncbi:MAG: GTP-binding protein [Candidatus Cloacimonas sp. 4484_143]|nr:MAG: GTP-binding protein [Candidatus Cloacimonas sp. 4484_143]RLC50945.1 MAG: GTP-binding protein [Candidatus Cloacimonadota bacterium]RLC51432.1 MAG: GTP-binding protein [Candidatus Cloacimonadota bacterium]
MRIVESKFVKSATKPAQYHPSPYAEIAFAGKSNVGKSSLINTLLGRKGIAKVSGTPGKTRLINFFEVRFKDKNNENGFLSFVDLPGYGYAKVSKTERAAWKKMIMTYLESRLNLNGVMLLVDIRHKADPKDILTLQMLKESNIPYAIAVTKSDKIAKSKIPSVIKKLALEFQVKKEDLFPVSSLKKTGIDAILNWVNDLIL